MGRTRGHGEIVPVIPAQPLNIGGGTPITTQFPIGEAYRRLIIRVNTTLVVGTGTTPISDGEVSIIKSINLRTDNGEVLCSNIPGRILYYADAIKNRTASPKTAIAAANGVYSVMFSIWFSDPLLQRPDDTILDTSRVRSLKLDINMGTVADLLGTVGTATITATADIYVERQAGRLPDLVKPNSLIEYVVAGALNPASQQYIDLERGQDQAMKRLYIMATNSAGSTAFSGTLSNTTLADYSLDCNDYNLHDGVLWTLGNGLTKTNYQLETAITGLNVIDLVPGGSIFESLWAGKYSRLRVKWTNGTLSTSLVSVMVESMRQLKGSVR